MWMGSGVKRCDRIKQRGGSERLAMKGRVPVPGQRRQMIRGGIALVLIVAIPRVGKMVRDHLTIASHLGHDRRRGNRAAPPISVHDAALRDLKVGNPEGVHEYQVR